MRITNQLIYNNFNTDYSRDSNLMHKLTSQISSGHKIQNSFDNTSVYIDSSRLEYEKTSLTQIKNSSQSAQTFANNSDTILNEFTNSLIKFKTKLIQAANGTHNTTSLNAIADNLEAIKSNLMDLSNSSINGKFLFSGTAFSTKPIDSNGNYRGNAQEIKATTGAQSSLPYNIDGESLFLGSDNDYKKILSTNVKMYSDDKHQNILKSSDKIENLMKFNGGGTSASTDAYFYIQAKNSDGSSFKKKIDINVNDTVQTLLNKIKSSFTPSSDVNATLNNYGQIEITDEINGNKSLDFSMVGSYDDASSVDNLTNPVSFVNSGYIQSAGTSEAVSFDRNYFSVNGNKLSSNVSQIDKKTNDFATASTKLVDAAGVSSLYEKTLNLKYDDINGISKTATINLKSTTKGGSKFTINGKSYNIYGVNTNPSDANNMTYQQLNDVVGMIISDNLPATNDKAGYDNAVANSKNSINVSLDNKGEMQIQDKSNPSTKIKFSMYDSKSGDFNPPATGNSLSFVSNNAIAVDKPSIDFFKDMDQMISAVREGKFSMDSTSGDKRNIGMENSIKRVSHLLDHVLKLHSKIGSFSNALNSTYQRSDILSLQVTTLQSQVSDVDMGAALAKYNQISVGFQALLSTIAKVNSISLLKYI